MKEAKNNNQKTLASINKNCAEKIIDFDQKSKYIVDFEKSGFHDYEGNYKDFKAKVILETIKEKTKRIVTINFNGLGKNNKALANIHTFPDLPYQYYWDGQLMVGGMASKALAHKTKASDVVEQLKKVKDSEDSFVEVVNILKNYTNIEFHPDSNYTYKNLDGTHAHDSEGTLHFIFMRKNKNNKKDVSQVSNVIKLFAAGDIYGPHQNSGANNPINLGTITFKAKLTPLGYRTTSDEFLALARAEATKNNNNSKKMLEFMKKYIVFEGDIDEQKCSIYFDWNISHTHGSGNLHFYVQVTNKTDKDMVVNENMKITPKKLGGIQFGINGWGREAAFVGLTFDRRVGFKDVSDEKAIWRITSPIDVLKELNNKNINEQLAILKKYVYIDGTIDNKYDLSIDINSSLANYSDRKDSCDYSLVLDKCKADDENGTLTLVVKEVDNFNNETTEETITFGNLFASKADANETSIFDNSLVFYKHLQCNKLASNVLAELSLITDEKEKLNKQLEYLENNNFIKTKNLI